ncbi:MAG: SDR family oxidoreductase [Bacteroidia bacterium]
MTIPDQKIKKPVAIITGASRGIGAATALRLAEQGYQTVLVARKTTDLQALAATLPGESFICGGSVTDEAFIEKIVSQTIKLYGRIDLVVLNAGVGSFGEIEKTSAQDYDRMMEVNVKGSFLLTKAVTPFLKEQKSGTFIFITSDVATRTFAGGSIYCASKYAQHALSDALRKEVRPFGIRVGAIYPGLTATNFADSDPHDTSKAGWLKPNDIADAISYIAEAPAHVSIDSIMLHPMEQDW